jgi:hypothetical protein
MIQDNSHTKEEEFDRALKLVLNSEDITTLKVSVDYLDKDGNRVVKDYENSKNIDELGRAQAERWGFRK